MSEFVKVIEEPESDEVIELPSEDDGSLLLTTLTAQFPDAIGLRYKVPETGSVRGVRLTEGRLLPPDNTWTTYTFICTYPKAAKRKATELEDSPFLPKRDDKGGFTNSVDPNNFNKRQTSDLVVLDLPFKMDEHGLKEYFSQYGEVVLSQIKRDNDGRSKGFGFVRFEKYDSQIQAMSKKHLIEGRWCEVKIPNNKFQGEDVSNRVFIGRITESMTEEDLQQYFSKFGEIANVFLPKNPFRGFAFLTYIDPLVALSLRNQDHTVKGQSVSVYPATPKPDKPKQQNQSQSTGRQPQQGGVAQHSAGGDSTAQIAAAVAAALAQAGVVTGGAGSYQGGYSGYGSYGGGHGGSTGGYGGSSGNTWQNLDRRWK